MISTSRVSLFSVHSDNATVCGKHERKIMNDFRCRCCYVEAKKRVLIGLTVDDSEDDEYFDAIEDVSVDVKTITLPPRPKRSVITFIVPALQLPILVSIIFLLSVQPVAHSEIKLK